MRQPFAANHGAALSGPTHKYTAPTHHSASPASPNGRGSPVDSLSSNSTPSRRHRGSTTPVLDDCREKGLSLAQTMARSSCNCSMAFRSTQPRFAPNRTFGGRDPRAILAEDSFTGKHAFQYQSPRAYVYNRGSTERPFGQKAGPNGPGVDSFRYGVIVKEPSRANTPFASTLPRLTTVRPLEPIRRLTYGHELNSRSNMYLPLTNDPR